MKAHYGTVIFSGKSQIVISHILETQTIGSHFQEQAILTV
jgi:hypothetical protein